MSEEDVKRLEGKVDKMLLVINGNGDPGLAEQTRVNAKAICSHIKFCENKNKQRFDLFRVFVGSILSLIVALLLKIVLT